MRAVSLFSLTLAAAILIAVIAATTAHASPRDQRGGNRVQASFTLPAPEEADDGAPTLGEDNPRMVYFPAIVVPLTRDGQLIGYAYTTVRMMVREGVDAWRVRERAHFALDAMIRASHRESLTDATGRNLDLARTRQVWTAALVEYFGPGVVDQIAVTPPDTRQFRR